MPSRNMGASFDPETKLQINPLLRIWAGRQAIHALHLTSNLPTLRPGNAAATAALVSVYFMIGVPCVV